MLRFLTVLAVALFAFQPALSQKRSSDSPRQAKAGEVVRLDDGLTLKAARSDKSPFAGVKVKGEQFVVVLEIDAVKRPTTVFYAAGADSKSSAIYLTAGTQKVAPTAVMEDFPSWGADNDKEVEVLDPSEGAGGSTIEFEGKGYINLLFDVSPAQAKLPRKLTLELKTSKPAQQSYSVVVSF
jgi:hypothetical protein